MLKTWKQVAAALNIGEKGLRMLRARDGWPGPKKKLPKTGVGPAMIKKIKAWRADTVGEDHAAGQHHNSTENDTNEFDAKDGDLDAKPGDLGRLHKKTQIAVNQERFKTAKQNREIKEGLFVERHLLDSGMGGLANVFVGILEEIEQTWPGRFGNKTPGALAKEMPTVLDAYKRRLIEKGKFELMTLDELQRQQREGRKGATRGRPTGGGR